MFTPDCTNSHTHCNARIHNPDAPRHCLLLAHGDPPSLIPKKNSFQQNSRVPTFRTRSVEKNPQNNAAPPVLPPMARVSVTTSKCLGGLDGVGVGAPQVLHRGIPVLLTKKEGGTGEKQPGQYESESNPQTHTPAPASIFHRVHPRGFVRMSFAPPEKEAMSLLAPPVWV